LLREIKIKRSIKNAPYAVYVTEKALQKRYPCNGKMLGCSDVELNLFEDKHLKDRIEKIEKRKDEDKIILGTAAYLDVAFKGQKDVIKTISKLEKKGVKKFEYQMIGSGTGKKLKKLIKKYGLQDKVKILGAIPHNEVFEWMKNIDIYIHPSYTEGLCRSIVEAMSTGCPIICSRVGGNSELAAPYYIYKKRNYVELEKILKNITTNELKKEANRSFELSKEYQKEILDKKRNEFYKKFMKL